ncbi:MAG: WYL domain-containing protein [Pseudomonadota bacterium]
MGIFSRLREVLSGRTAPDQAPRHLSGERPGAADSADMHPEAAAEPAALLDGIRLEIGYEDADGRGTNRLITCKRMVHSEDGDRLLAFCHTRRSDRTFLLDRILEAAEHATGRRISDIQTFFAPLIDQAGELDDDHGTTREIITQIGDELRILAFIAKADMSLHKAEDELISLFVRQRSESLGAEVAGNYDHTKVMDWFRHQVPDLEVLERAVMRVAKRSEGQLGHVWELAAKVMEADGTVRAEELDRLHQLAQAVDHALEELRKGNV